MSGIFDRVKAMGAGAAQGATMGWGDEGVARILAALPQQDDGTGIPRNYRGGQYEQYRDNERRDNTTAREANPNTYAASQIIGSIPLPAAAVGAAPAAVLGLTAAEGATTMGGLNERPEELTRDVGTGAAMGLAGGLAAKGAARVAAPIIKSMARRAPVPTAYHATPIENMGSVAQRGLDTSEAMKNFALKKNAGRTYFTDTPEGVQKWNQTIRDATGSEAAPVLRTSAATQKVPGANEAVLIRNESTPKNMLEVYDPSKRAWSAVEDFRATPGLSAEDYIPPPEMLRNIEMPTGKRADVAKFLQEMGQ